MKNLNVIMGVCVGAVIGFTVDRLLVQNASAQPSAAAARAFADSARDALRQQATGDQVFKVLLGGSPSKGREDAKVTIVEWSDFQCPFCGRAANTMKEVERIYGSDLRLVFKHNPLPMHPDAPFAAKAAVAAGRQGKFWEMHDKLFEANNRGAQTELSRPKVEAMARQIDGLDVERWRGDADSDVL